MPLILDGMASLCCAASLEKQRFSAFALLTWLSWSIEKGKTCPSLPSSRWQLIKWAKPLLLYMKMVCAHIIGTDHFLFNVAGVVIFFYIVLITIEPV